MLKIGDKMPSFEVMDQDGNMVKSEDFIGKGKKTIIYFYPKIPDLPASGLNSSFPVSVLTAARKVSATSYLRPFSILIPRSITFESFSSTRFVILRSAPLYEDLYLHSHDIRPSG